MVEIIAFGFVCLVATLIVSGLVVTFVDQFRKSYKDGWKLIDIALYMMMLGVGLIIMGAVVVFVVGTYKDLFL